ncbi:hypothetical protein B0H11DRAFT_2244529 [Mycena galericulata]|nr:hypothetical protein B0H11DRAFT_2244529 [Mycena galericulata]
MADQSIQTTHERVQRPPGISPLHRDLHRSLLPSPSASQSTQTASDSRHPRIDDLKLLAGRSLIEYLPSELLSLIFSFVIEHEKHEEAIQAFKDLCAAFHTSCRWRKILAESPRLWAELMLFTPNTTRICGPFITHFNLADNPPISLDAVIPQDSGVNDTFTDGYLSLIVGVVDALEHRGGHRKLSIVAADSLLPLMLFQYMRAAAPELTILDLEQTDDTIHSVFDMGLFAATAPKLRHLRVVEFRGVWNSPLLKNLTTLSLTLMHKDDTVQLTLSTVLSALRTCTQLEELVLAGDVMPRYSGTGRPVQLLGIPVVALPRLRRLDLLGNTDDIQQLILHLAIPRHLDKGLSLACADPMPPPQTIRDIFSYVNERCDPKPEPLQRLEVVGRSSYMLLVFKFQHSDVQISVCCPIHSGALLDAMPLSSVKILDMKSLVTQHGDNSLLVELGWKILLGHLPAVEWIIAAENVINLLLALLTVGHWPRGYLGPLVERLSLLLFDDKGKHSHITPATIGLLGDYKKARGDKWASMHVFMQQGWGNRVVCEECETLLAEAEEAEPGDPGRDSEDLSDEEDGSATSVSSTDADGDDVSWDGSEIEEVQETNPTTLSLFVPHAISLPSPLKLGSIAREYHPVTPPIRIRIRRRAGNVFAGAVSASPAAAPSPTLPNTLVVLFSNFIGAVEEDLRALGWSAPARTLAPHPHASVATSLPLYSHTHAFLPAWTPLPSWAREIVFPSTGTFRGLLVRERPLIRPWHAAYWFVVALFGAFLDSGCRPLFPRDAAPQSMPAPPPCCSAWSAATPVCLLRNDPMRLLARATTYISTHPPSAASASCCRLPVAPIPLFAPPSPTPRPSTHLCQVNRTYVDAGRPVRLLLLHSPVTHLPPIPGDTESSFGDCLRW